MSRKLPKFFKGTVVVIARIVFMGQVSYAAERLTTIRVCNN